MPSRKEGCRGLRWRTWGAPYSHAFLEDVTSFHVYRLKIFSRVVSFEDIDSSSHMAIGKAVHTYHCCCSQHVLTTIYDLASLPSRRDQTGSPDVILPCPASPENGEFNGGSNCSAAKASGPTIISALELSKTPVMVKKQAGYEKRWRVHCARCRSTIGYQLDSSHFPGDASKGRRGDVMYLVEGSTISTEALQR